MAKTSEYFSSKSIFFSNFASNVGFFALNTIIGILFVPYLISRLGVSLYGLVPLTMSIASYFNVVTIVLNSAAWRSMTIALQRDDGEASKIFNSAFWLSMLIAVILLLLGVFLSAFISRWFNVPPGDEAEAVRLVFLTMVAFSIFSVCSSLGIISYSLNRLDLQNLGNTLGLIVRVSMVLILFNIYGAHLWHVGLGLVASAFTILMVDIWAWKYLLPEVKVSIGEVSLKALQSFTKTSFWLIINRFGTIILVSVNLLTANKLFGSELSGRYASVMQWSLFLSNFGIVIAAIFGPTIMAFYARKDMDGLIRYAKKSIKFVGLLLALPIGLICGASRPLLSVWLGKDFVSLALLMAVMTFHLCANLAYLPLDTILLATNKVRLASLTQITLVGVNIILAIAFAKGLGLGLYGIAFAGALVLSLKNILFNSIYTAILLNRGPLLFLKELFLLVVAPGSVALMAYWTTSVFKVNSWFSLSVSFAVVSLAYLVFVWRVLLEDEERSLVIQFIKRT